MDQPLVTVICLCYNQANFIREAVESVIAQTYPHIQLIIVDDASTDPSVQHIEILKQEHPAIELKLLKQNLGNCAAFNQGLAMAKGDYIIDLAADDILLPERIERGVKRLTTAGKTYGVHFSDALLIREDGSSLHRHSSQIQLASIPSGDVYEAVIRYYFICSPTMMIRREVLEELGGYDETLYYEDFDFWIRSARNYWYDYSDEVLVKKRVVNGSLSDVQFSSGSNHWRSTLQVLQKVRKLNKRPSEDQALRDRLLYEIGYHLKRGSVIPSLNFLQLLLRMLFKF